MSSVTVTLVEAANADPNQRLRCTLSVNNLSFDGAQALIDARTNKQKWNEAFFFTLSKPLWECTLTVDCFDEDNYHVGQCSFPLKALRPQKPLEIWLPLDDGTPHEEQDVTKLVRVLLRLHAQSSNDPDAVPADTRRTGPEQTTTINQSIDSSSGLVYSDASTSDSGRNSRASIPTSNENGLNESLLSASEKGIAPLQPRPPHTRNLPIFPILRVILWSVLLILVTTFWYAIPQYLFPTQQLVGLFLGLFAVVALRLGIAVWNLAIWYRRNRDPLWYKSLKERGKDLFYFTASKIRAQRPRQKVWTYVAIASWVPVVLAISTMYVSIDRTGSQSALLNMIDALLVSVALLVTVTLAFFLIAITVRLIRFLTVGVSPMTVSAFLSGVTSMVILGYHLKMSVTSSLEFVIILALNITLFSVSIGALRSIIGYLFSRSRRGPIRQVVVPLIMIAITACCMVPSLISFVEPGFHYDSPPKRIDFNENSPIAHLPNPAEKGSFATKSIIYGSGDINRKRSEYANVYSHYLTAPVDGSAIIEMPESLKGYWGFGTDRLPINGLIWMPNITNSSSNSNDSQPTKFPLLVIVHGDFNMMRPSERGYGYLGELFASKGYVVVSIDNCFLNSWREAGDKRTASEALELPLRGWIILEHLAVLRTWTNNASHPLYQRLDMNGITLLGHSRGAEAAVIAHMFNNLTRPPTAAQMEFPQCYSFDIKGIIAVTGGNYYLQYRTGGWPSLDINMLVIGASYDANNVLFTSHNHYHSLRFTHKNTRFLKTVLFVGHTDRSQYNTEWGIKDVETPWNWFLSKASLLEGEKQRKILKVYTAAFLQFVSHGSRAYLPLFIDWRSANSEWLPNTEYTNQYEDNSFILVDNFEGKVDITKTTPEGGSHSIENMDKWAEERISYRSWISTNDELFESLQYDNPRYNNRAVRIGWSGERTPQAPARYVTTLPANFTTTTKLTVENTTFAFDFAVDSKTVDLLCDDEQLQEYCKRFTVGVSFGLNNGSEVVAPNVHVYPSQPVRTLFKHHVVGRATFYGGQRAQTVLSTHTIPLRGVLTAEQFRKLEKISFVFAWGADKKEMAVVVDNIGFYPGVLIH